MAQQIQLRNDITANWASANPVLARGEVGVDTTLGKFKIGNGTSTWSQLDYHANSDLVVPTAIKDTNGDDLITFERTGTGTARIGTPQDDLSLRSARDITLIAGNDGPGNVYIGWGDATITPDASNRVATLADIDANPKTWTAENDVQYTIRQAHGGTQVQTAQYSIIDTEVGAPTNQVNQTTIQITLSMADDALFAPLITNNNYIRSIVLNINGNSRVLKDPSRISDDGTNAIWQFVSDTPITLDSSTGYGFVVRYDGPPVLWWNADDLGFIQDSNNYWHFRGAKIDYHAYVNDGGTVIGTIYIASDSDDSNVTHIETSSGGNDAGAAHFWHRKTWTGSTEERKLYLYRIDGESQVHKIHWTAQVYYAAEAYGD